MLLEIKNLFLKYVREFYALYDINLSLSKGERMAFLGAEDSGKTSLIRVLVGLENYNEGEIYYNEISLKKINFLTDINLGYLPATPVFLENKTVYQNLVYILKQRKFSKAEIEEKINKAVIDFQIERIKDTKIKNLTIFEQIMISLVRLSFRDLDIVVIDNIFDNLKDFELDIILKLINYLFVKNKTAMIVATTKEEIAKELAGKIVKFSNGSIVG